MSEVLSPPVVAAPTLDHLRLLRVVGPDARSFLDAQLTRNVPPPGVASLAGYCSPKGRLLASAVVWADEGTVSLLVSADIADAIAKRLRMYVLRAKATIEASPAHAVTGYAGSAAAPTLAPWATTTIDDRTWIRVPDAAGRARHLRVAPEASASAGEDTIAARTWRWLDIRAGLPRITLATQERFVPQMLNLEALGGVDFKKGCFPGQEIVARSQYLGKLKRRMALASLDGSDAPPAPGTDVWNTRDAEPCGLVVDAELGDDGRIAALIELPLASFDAVDLHVGGPDGPALTIEPLPYPLPDNEVFVRPKL